MQERSKLEAITRGLKGKCPNCGEGEMFDKWLKVTPDCAVCGEELHHEQAQDFPPYIVISIVGHVIITLLMIVEANFVWSMTTHVLVWVPLTIALSLALMQPIKGAVVGLQWALRMFGFDHEEPEPEGNYGGMG